MIKQCDPKKRGKASRNKGKSGELELMQILNKEHLNTSCRFLASVCA